jgi:hypothetical protein
MAGLPGHLWNMTKHPPDSPFALSVLMTQLTVASWETIMRRTAMMVQGNCSLSEYHRMGAEKLAAAQQSMLALATGRGHAAALAPYVAKTRANVRRLRRKA